MLKIPIKMPKSCRVCPFLISDCVYGGEVNAFHCVLIQSLRCYGGYDEKYHNIIGRTNVEVKNIKTRNEDCILAKINKQKAR